MESVDRVIAVTQLSLPAGAPGVEASIHTSQRNRFDVSHRLHETLREQGSRDGPFPLFTSGAKEGTGARGPRGLVIVDLGSSSPAMRAGDAILATKVRIPYWRNLAPRSFGALLDLAPLTSFYTEGRVSTLASRRVSRSSRALEATFSAVYPRFASASDPGAEAPKRSIETVASA
jgi:hypothetical protein